MVRTRDIQSKLLLEKHAPLILSLLHIPHGIEARLPERPASYFRSQARHMELHKD